VLRDPQDYSQGRKGRVLEAERTVSGWSAWFSGSRSAMARLSPLRRVPISLKSAVWMGLGFMMLLAPPALPESSLVAIGQGAEAPLGEVEQSYLSARGPIRICVDPDSMPFEAIRDGEYVGMGADFMALMATRVELEWVLIPTESWSESLDRAEARDCDVLPLAMETPRRAGFMDFTTPYLETPSVIATDINQHFVDDLALVAHQPLGIMRDFSFAEIYREHYPGINLVEVDSYEVGVTKVVSGELFGMLGDMASIGHAIQKTRASSIKIAGRIEGDSLLSVATRNDEPMLNHIFEQLVQSLSSAEKQAVINEWYSIRYDMGYDYSAMIKLALVFVFGTMIILFWSQRLRIRNLELRASNVQLAELNRRDPLTGIHNRIHFDDRLEHALGLCRREKRPLAIAMVDLDHFKKINDDHGHAFGDHCLKQLCVIMQGLFQRESDTVARYGGEEFVILSEDGDRNRFVRQVEQFRRRVAEAPVQYEGGSVNMTISAGVWSAVPDAGESGSDFLRNADLALYEAKHQGRNRVVIRSRS